MCGGCVQDFWASPPPDRPCRRGFTRQPENSKRAHLSAPAVQTPPKSSKPPERRKNEILWRERPRLASRSKNWLKSVWPKVRFAQSRKIRMAKVCLAKVGLSLWAPTLRGSKLFGTHFCLETTLRAIPAISHHLRTLSGTVSTKTSSVFQQRESKGPRRATSQALARMAWGSCLTFAFANWLKKFWHSPNHRPPTPLAPESLGYVVCNDLKTSVVIGTPWRQVKITNPHVECDPGGTRDLDDVNEGR